MTQVAEMGVRVLAAGARGAPRLEVWKWRGYEAQGVELAACLWRCRVEPEDLIHKFAVQELENS